MSGELEDIKTPVTTEKKQSHLFTKNDPRINRAGRPKGSKNRQDIQERIQALMYKLAKDAHGKIVLDEGQELTRFEALFLKAIQKANTMTDIEKIVDIMYGKEKTKDEIDVNVNIKAYTKVSPDDWEDAKQD